ncbi:hypothetical protein EVAR_90575_1 [Eumeta japonica]|uniref:Uncharacterized protein n=1 Tax=Eumeta variegata TaxID=151549 RepID=A0A4C1YR38_EUMVA|nr:hypothetical protein EVAR_90575_1 [Eumeta japonica]
MEKCKGGGVLPYLLTPLAFHPSLRKLTVQGLDSEGRATNRVGVIELCVSKQSRATRRGADVSLRRVRRPLRDARINHLRYETAIEIATRYTVSYRVRTGKRHGRYCQGPATLRCLTCLNLVDRGEVLESSTAIAMTRIRCDGCRCGLKDSSKLLFETRHVIVTLPGSEASGVQLSPLTAKGAPPRRPLSGPYTLRTA